MSLTILGTSYECDHTVFVFSWLAYSTEHNVLKVHPCFSMCQNSSLFKAEWYCIECTYHVLFIYSSVDGHQDCFHFLAIVNNASMNMGVQIFENLLFLPLGIYPQVELLNHMVILFLIFWGNHHTLFHNSCTILYSYQCCARVPVSPYPGWHSLFSIFL